MEEQYKLTTRRYLAWGLGGLAIATVAFTGIWGVVVNATELVTLSLGILGTAIGSIIGFYFSKKVSDE